VHYASAAAVAEEGDNTTISVSYARGPPPARRAGVFLLATDGKLPPMVEVNEPETSH